ncbi:MAG: hypothetical protein AAB290_02775 [Candidatus Eisenbacteria bacterium]
MNRRSARCLVVLAILLGLLPGATTASHAAPGDRKTLVLRGRVTDAEGWPVAGARVSVRGTRRASATVDDAGQFVLNLPLGSLADLARNPIALRVHAEQRGWRLALPGGEAELGLKLRVVSGDDGVARCEVRSNQPRVTAAIARALTADGDATGVAIVSFIGTRGEAIGSPETLDLPVVDRVALAGVRVPTASPPGTPPAASATPKKKGAGTDGSESTKAKRSGKSPTREPERSGPPVSAAPAKSSPAAAPPPSEAERELAAARRRAAREGSVAGDEAKRTREAQEKRWDALRHEVHMIAGTYDTTSPPPVAALDGLAGAPARPEHRGRAIARPRLTAGRDTVAVRPPQPMPEPPAESPWARTPAPGATSPARATRAPSPERPRAEPEPSAAAASAKPAGATTSGRRSESGRGAATDPSPEGVSPAAPTGASGPESGTSRIFPRPEGESRARARPLVIRTPGVRPAEAGTLSAAGDSCTCRIEGTVEADSDEPLPGRTRVAVSLAWYPAIADTVELFMGSPRGFSLPVAPCGPQRLRLVNLGALRFDVSSREAMAGFRCERGALHQFRVVLQPR